MPYYQQYYNHHGSRSTIPDVLQQSYAWWWTINNHKIAAEHPEWLSVNRNGHSIADSMAYVEYYKFLSPIIPGVREEICKQVEEICQIEGEEGIAIDYHRLVDVVLPTTLWQFPLCAASVPAVLPRS